MSSVTHGTKLIDEEPLLVLPALAVAVGLNEAIILQQIHYWINPKRKSGKVVDGLRWIFNSYEQWREQFPFWTQKQIGDAIRSLEKQGVLLSRQDLNSAKSDRTKWYTINYDHEILGGSGGDGQDPSEDDQHTKMYDQRTSGDDQRTFSDDQHTDLVRSSYTETTTETTAERFDAGASPLTDGPSSIKVLDAEPQTATQRTLDVKAGRRRKVRKNARILMLKNAFLEMKGAKDPNGMHEDAWKRIYDQFEKLPTYIKPSDIRGYMEYRLFSRPDLRETFKPEWVVENIVLWIDQGRNTAMASSVVNKPGPVKRDGDYWRSVSQQLREMQEGD